MIEMNFAQYNLALGVLFGTLIGISLDELLRAALAIRRQR